MSAKPTSETPERKKKNSFTTMIVWALMAMLVLGLGGFGVSNFGGSVRAIGAVGEEEIGLNEYALALQQELRALSQQTGQSLSLSQAEALSQIVYGQSVSDGVLARLYTTAALDGEADRIGLSVGDQQVRQQVLGVTAFQGLDGSFDREAYTFALQQAGLSEREYEDGVREEAARTLLQGAVVGGVAPARTLSDTLLSFAAERRNFTWFKLGPGDLDAPLPEPTEEDLQAFHDAHPEAFTAPEKKRITYARLTPDMLLDTIVIDEDALRDLYDERIDEYRQPERRLVERLVFEDDAAAQAAYDRLLSGEITFDALVAERGLTLSDIDLGDLEQGDLGEAADAVFALAEPGNVTAPTPSSLGPALFRMNGILNAQETTFEEARAALVGEFAQDRARRVIAEMSSEIEDLLAGGATLEEVADETEMTLDQIDWWSGLDDDIAAYEDFRSAAGEVSEDDFPEVMELDDGGIFALRLDEVIAPALQPLDEVHEDVRVGWQQQETETRLIAQAEAILADTGAGETPRPLGLTMRVESDVTRDAFIDETPPGFTEAVFEMESGESRVIEGPAMALIVTLDDVLGPDAANPDTEELRTALDASIAQSLGQDMFSAYARALQAQAGISRDQAALNAVHAQFP